MDLESPKAEKICELCEAAIDLKTKYSERNLFFHTIQVEKQLQIKVQKAITNKDIQFVANDESSEINTDLNDIFDGENHKGIISSYTGQNFITLARRMVHGHLSQQVNKSVFVLAGAIFCERNLC